MTEAKKLQDTFSRLRGSVIGSRDARFRTVLLAYGNPDYGQNPHEPFCGSLTVYADAVEDLIREERNWIRENLLGSGNFVSAEVWDNRPGQGNRPVGTIYYNGRFVPA